MTVISEKGNNVNSMIELIHLSAWGKLPEQGGEESKQRPAVHLN